MTELAPDSHLRAVRGPAVPRARAPRVVALGDSVTVGVGDQVRVGEHPGWAAHLASALQATAFVNLAVNGARARDVRDRQLSVALAQRPDIATVVVGGNDVLRGDFDAASVANDVGITCDALTRQGADVIVIGLHDPSESLPGPRTVRGVLSRRARAVNDQLVMAVGDVAGVTFIDPRGRLDAADRTLWHIDRMHPGPLGHRAMARMVIGELDHARWEVVSAVPPPPAHRPRPTQQAAWLVRHGVPWFAKRSRDLLPELARVCWAERHLVDQP